MNNMSGVCVCASRCHVLQPNMPSLRHFFSFFLMPVALSLRRLHPTKSDQHALQPVSIL